VRAVVEMAVKTMRQQSGQHLAQQIQAAVVAGERQMDLLLVLAVPALSSSVTLTSSDPLQLQAPHRFTKQAGS
jgi:hypothetical protein